MSRFARPQPSDPHRVKAAAARCPHPVGSESTHVTSRRGRSGLLLLALALVLLPACSSIGGSRSRQRLTFAEMQALNPGVRGAWVVSRFPFARQTSRRPDGSLQRLVYSVTDPHGRVEDVTLDFDARGVLVRKHYAGAWLRPPLRVD